MIKNKAKHKNPIENHKKEHGKHKNTLVGITDATRQHRMQALATRVI